LDNPKFILLDEADFFRKSEQEDVRHVYERYIAKSDPFIVMVSTPYAPDGLFDSIEKEPEESCIYKLFCLTIPDFNEMLEKTWELIFNYSVQKIYIDGANPSFIKFFEDAMG
jgi:hypothetical protein